MSARIAVDIGGTFTDVALEHNGVATTAKVLTTPAAPEEAALAGMLQALARARVAPEEVTLIIHGTTLATNALIERKGAHTALITTAGFRDAVEMGQENRFEQYDINIVKPEPLVPRHLRLEVRERVDAQGGVRLPLDMMSLEAAIDALDEAGIESVAVGLVHAYANTLHEQRIRDRLCERLPSVSITLASEVCPEIREYERLSTACANAYVQPVMARYLRGFETRLHESGFRCPLYIMLSGGGLTTVDTAITQPIRLVESGPAGGAMLAAGIARELGLDRVVSFDMGGTTAKICLIDDGVPQRSRSFEVDRVYRFVKGSGLPLRIPVIEMVEIGAGGGSMARVDALKRITVGPDSAGADPGPACYGRGGTEPTVTDADVVLGRIDPESFAGGSMPLDAQASRAALDRVVGGPLDLEPLLAAFGVSEMVDENMAAAARVHAIEGGKALAGRTLIAFGGAAPLRAAGLSAKLGIDRVIVPRNAGVGSAVGFLAAPVSYEMVRSRYQRLDDFSAGTINTMLAEMSARAHSVVQPGAGTCDLNEQRSAFMRYVGQGHEIEVPVPLRTLDDSDADQLHEAFEAVYRQHYRRVLSDVAVEALTWTVTVSAPTQAAVDEPVIPSATLAERSGVRSLFRAEHAAQMETPVYERDSLVPGTRLTGAAVIVEAQTTTVVPEGCSAWVDAFGHLCIERGHHAGEGVS